MKSKERREDRAGRRREAGEERRKAARRKGRDGTGPDPAPRAPCASWPRRWPPCWPRPRPQVSGTAGAQRPVPGRPLRRGLPPSPSCLGAVSGLPRQRGWPSGPEQRQHPELGRRERGLTEMFWEARQYRREQEPPPSCSPAAGGSSPGAGGSRIPLCRRFPGSRRQRFCTAT